MREGYLLIISTIILVTSFTLSCYFGKISMDKLYYVETKEIIDYRNMEQYTCMTYKNCALHSRSVNGMMDCIMINKANINELEVKELGTYNPKCYDSSDNMICDVQVTTCKNDTFLLVFATYDNTKIPTRRIELLCGIKEACFYITASQVIDDQLKTVYYDKNNPDIYDHTSPIVYNVLFIIFGVISIIFLIGICGFCLEQSECNCCNNCYRHIISREYKRISSKSDNEGEPPPDYNPFYQRDS